MKVGAVKAACIVCLLTMVAMYVAVGSTIGSAVIREVNKANELPSASQAHRNVPLTKKAGRIALPGLRHPGKGGQTPDS